MSAPSPLDLVVVGAGPAGLGTAIAAARAGLDYEVVEKGALVNSIYRFPRGMTFFTTPELLELGNLPFVTPYAQAHARGGPAVLPPRGRHPPARRVARRAGGVDRARAGAFAVTTAVERPGGEPLRRERRARSVVIATGTYDQPNALGIPGEDLPHVSHYFDEPHACHRRRVVVVGGSNSAAEAALALFRAGALVTLVHRRERLSGSIKYWVKPDIENRIAENAIAARFETEVVRIGPGSVEVEGPEGREEIPAEAVYLLTGYHPDTALLERAGVRVDARTLAAGARPADPRDERARPLRGRRPRRRLGGQPRLHRERPLPRHDRREGDPRAGRGPRRRRALARPTRALPCPFRPAGSA